MVGTVPRTSSNATASVEDWRGSGGDSSDTGTCNAALADLNLGDRALRFPARTYVLEDLLIPITARDAIIEGAYAGTTLRFPGFASSFDEIGTYFRFGTATTEAINVMVRGFQFHVQKALVDDDVFAVRFDYATNCHVHDIVPVGIAGIMKYGTDTTASIRCSIKNWIGSCNQGMNSDANIYIRNGATGYIKDLVVIGTTAGGSSNGALVKIAPIPGGGIDTFIWDGVLMAVFDAAVSTTGKPYGVHIDRTQGDVTNQWFVNSGWDHTSVAGFYFDGSTGSTGLFTRLMQVANCRFGTETGHGILVNNAGGGILRGTNFMGCTTAVNTDHPCFELNAPGVHQDIGILGNSFLEAGTATTKAAAVKLNGKGWVCSNNRIGSAGTIQKFVTGFVIEGAGSDDFALGQNVVAPGINYVTEPAYTVPASLNRRVDRPTNVRRLRLAANFTTTSATLVDITGLTGIPVRANTTYKIEAMLIWQSSILTEGAAFALAGPVSPTMVGSRFAQSIDNAATNGTLSINHRRSLNSGSASLSVDAINADMFCTGTVLLTVGADITALSVRVASEATATITVKAGSYIEICEVS